MTTYHTSSEALPHLLSRILYHGKLRTSRNGEMKELVHVQETIADPTRPYITTPGRHASLPAQIAEMMWLLSGRDDIEWLSHYLPRAPEFSDDGEKWRGAYGPRIRGSYGGPDQLAYVVDLLKTEPDSRRAVINIYDPKKDSRPGKDIPCNNWIHFLIRDGILYTHVATRSNDVMWGWSGINAFEWSVLAQIVASLTSTSPGPVTFSVSSLHLYDRHFDKAERIVGESIGIEDDLDSPSYGHYLGRAPGVGDLSSVSALDRHVVQWFRAEQIVRSMSGPLRSAVEAVENPLFRSWIEVMYAYWTGDCSHLDNLYAGTDLLAAYRQSPKRRKASSRDQLVREVSDLHREKGKVYGTSWRKRGETYSILPNVARKVDRLGVSGAGDSELDTYIDLVVYLVKYHTWLTVGEAESDDPDVIEGALDCLSSTTPRSDVDDVKETVMEIQGDYERLLDPTYTQIERVKIVRVMAEEAWRIARQLHREGVRL